MKNGISYYNLETVVSIRIYHQKHERVSRRPGELLGRHRRYRYRWNRGNGRDSATLAVLTWTIQPPLFLSLLPCFLFRLELAEGA